MGLGQLKNLATLELEVTKGDQGLPADRSNSYVSSQNIDDIQVTTMRHKLVGKLKTDFWHRLQLSCDRILMIPTKDAKETRTYWSDNLYQGCGESGFCFVASFSILTELSWSLSPQS